MLSVSQSAEVLGVSGARVRALIADGTLPATKLGRTWMLREEDVMQRASSSRKCGRPREREADDGLLDGLHPATQQSPPPDWSQLYRDCKEAFRFRPSADDLSGAKSREEAAFYVAVADFFLKQRQAEIVEAGVY